MSNISSVNRKWDQGITRYPDPAIEIVDQRFAKYLIGNAVVERLWTGARWSEGPVWFGDARCLIWSDIPNNSNALDRGNRSGHRLSATCQ